MFYFVLFGSYLLEAYSILMRDKKAVDPEGSGGGKELGGAEGGETIVRIYSIRKESISNKRES